MKLSHAVKVTSDRWHIEALLFIARMVKEENAEIVTQRWANGRLMSGVKGSRCNQFIAAEEFDALKSRGFKIFG